MLEKLFHIGDYHEPNDRRSRLINYTLKVWPRLSIHICSAENPDVHLHSHVWDFWSLILWGGYDEELLDPTIDQTIRKKYYGIGRINHKKHYQFHRLTPRRTTVTLFIKSKHKTKHVKFWKDGRPIMFMRYYMKCGYSLEEVIDHTIQIGSDPTLVPQHEKHSYARRTNGNSNDQP